MTADITPGWGTADRPADPLIQLSDVTERYEDDGQAALQRSAWRWTRARWSW